MCTRDPSDYEESLLVADKNGLEVYAPNGATPFEPYPGKDLIVMLMMPRCLCSTLRINRFYSIPFSTLDGPIEVFQSSRPKISTDTRILQQENVPYMPRGSENTTLGTCPMGTDSVTPPHTSLPIWGPDTSGNCPHHGKILPSAILPGREIGSLQVGPGMVHRLFPLASSPENENPDPYSTRA